MDSPHWCFRGSCNPKHLCVFPLPLPLGLWSCEKFPDSVFLSNSGLIFFTLLIFTSSSNLESLYLSCQEEARVGLYFTRWWISILPTLHIPKWPPSPRRTQSAGSARQEPWVGAPEDIPSVTLNKTASPCWVSVSPTVKWVRYSRIKRGEVTAVRAVLCGTSHMPGIMPHPSVAIPAEV